MKNKKLIALVLMVMVAGCMAKPAPDVGPWGYEFALGGFTDQRPADSEARLTEEMAFGIDKFMASWKAHTARDLFTNHQGKLRVTLNEYEATRSQNSYALTMGLRLEGRDEYGKLLADEQVRCNIVAQPGAVLLWNTVQEGVAGRDAKALTPEGRAEKMWAQVWDTCVHDLTTKFGQALLAGLSVSAGY